MENRLINKIDLDLSSAEIKSLISEIKLSLAFVVDVNHSGGGSELSVGEVLAKPLEMAGTSELPDSVYKPINSNITQYPVAGEFIVVMNTPLGRYYLTTVNLFNSTSDNIDVENVFGYVSFTDDEDINEKQISSDKKGQKSVLENNEPPFDKEYASPFSYSAQFGDVNIFGRYGNLISLTRSDELNGEILISSGINSIQLNNGSYSYSRKASVVSPPSSVENEISNQYEGEQIFMESDRIYKTAGERGIIQETSGQFVALSDGNMSLFTSKDVIIDGNIIDIGKNTTDRLPLGDEFMNDFRELMNSMVRFAENLQKQSKILSLSNAANNFLTDMNALGWDDFDKEQYLSKKVYVE